MKIALFGATGGLGEALLPLLRNKFSPENVIGLGSKDVDVKDAFKTLGFFLNNTDVDVVISLFGYNFDCLLHKMMNAMNFEEEMRRVIDTNIVGNLNVVTSCLPEMRKRGFGRIILVSSVASSRPIMGTALYSLSKCAIESLARSTALENGRYHVTCNAIQLGYFQSEHGMLERISPEYQTKIMERIPLKRWGKVEELFNTICFLIENEYVTGTALHISGGADL